MRIDKYLWSTRYYKTRNMASEACKKGHVRINGKAVKPSREVYKLDEIVAKYHGRIYLAKDVRVSKESFEKGYPQVEAFRKYRKENSSDPLKMYKLKNNTA